MDIYALLKENIKDEDLSKKCVDTLTKIDEHITQFNKKHKRFIDNPYERLGMCIEKGLRKNRLN